MKKMPFCWKKETALLPLLLFVFVLLFPAGVGARDVTVVFKPGYFSPLDTAFREIYGTGLTWGGEAGVTVWKNLDLLLAGSLFERTGELTFTKDETRVRIMRLGWGARYRFLSGKIQPYAGLGLSYTAFKETNFIGDVSTAESGLSASIGSLYALTSRLIVELSVEYSSCRINPTSVEVDIGGWHVALGFGYRFGPLPISDE